MVPVRVEVTIPIATSILTCRMLWQDSLSNCDKADAFANNAEQLSQIDDLDGLSSRGEWIGRDGHSSPWSRWWPDRWGSTGRTHRCGHGIVSPEPAGMATPKNSQRITCAL